MPGIASTYVRVLARSRLGVGCGRGAFDFGAPLGFPENLASVVITPGGGYTIDHSAIVYLLNAQGSVAGILSYGLPKERAIAQLSKIARDE